MLIIQKAEMSLKYEACGKETKASWSIKEICSNGIIIVIDKKGKRKKIDLLKTSYIIR